MFTNHNLPLEPTVIWMERETRIVRSNERAFITLTPAQYRLLSALRTKPSMDRPALLSVICPRDRHATMDNLKMHAHNLRRKVERFGLGIRSNPDRSVSLIVPPSTHIVEVYHAV